MVFGAAPQVDQLPHQLPVASLVLNVVKRGWIFFFEGILGSQIGGFRPISEGDIMDLMRFHGRVFSRI